MREREPADVGALLGRQLAVHEHIERLARHPERAVQEHEHDAEAEQRIDDRPAGRIGQDQRRDHRQVHEQVAAVVHAVGLDRDRAGAAHHEALPDEQRRGQEDRGRQHRDAERALLDRLRTDQAADGFAGEEQRRAEDEPAWTKAPIASALPWP